MKVDLHRIAANPDGTFGVLTVDGFPICLTLEEEQGGNQKDTAIPAGSYTCSKYSGTKYKNVWLVENVPNRSAILIHWGNTEDNTAGCILVGEAFAVFGTKRGITNSVKTFDAIKKILPDKFTLNIKDQW